MEYIRIEWDPTGHRDDARCPGCGSSWYKVIRNGKLVSIQCGQGHTPLRFLTEAQMRFR